MDPLLLQRALDAADIGVAITDREGIIQWVNPEFSRLTGYSREEAVGQSPRLLKSGAHPPSFYEDLWKTVLSGSPWHGELINRRKDGSFYSEQQSITPVCNALQEVTHFIAFKSDVTAAKRIEAALHESEQRHHSLIESLDEGVVLVDSKRRVQFANPAAETVFGLAPGDALGRDLMDFVVPADLPVLAAERERIARGEKCAFEVRVIRSDGITRTLNVKATPQFGADMKPQGALAVVRDITDKKAMVQRLALLAHSLESVDDCVSICAPDDRLLFVNRAFLKTYGYEEDELLGGPITIVRSLLNPPAVTDTILPATLAGGWRGELWNRRKDGTDFQVHLTTAAVLDESGSLVATVGVARDITEYKLFEDELKRAKVEAESASRAKSEFLATMSHEIRTPMNGVIGMTGLLLDTELTPEQREYAETVRKCGEALLTVINDILDFSKIEAGKLVIESLSFDLLLVLEEVNEMLAPRAEEKGIDLVLEYPSRSPRRFVGDAARVRQVVTNLVGNAIKFTPGGHVRITVECLERDETTASMRVAVHDTGVGVPQDKVFLLFKKFSQADGSTTRRYGGTGLGLAICRQLVELMGGSIGVESSLGAGSTFSFTLPLRLDSRPNVESANPAELRGLRVLVVDDQQVNRRVLTEQLTGWGMRHGSCASGEEALQALRAARECGDGYRFVLLDQQMPGMDGMAVASAIKTDPALGGTAVVMLSSVGMWGDVKPMEGGAIDACLVKPVRQSQLLGALAATWATRLKASPGVDSERRIAELKETLARRFADGPIRILIAEDNVVNQKVAFRMIGRLGIRADLAANGREAVEMTAMSPYNLVLMDCQMPEMDGYAAAAAIRSREGSGPRPAIVAMTAEAMAGSRDRCIEAGMDDYIPKPVKFEELAEALGKWLIARGPARPPEPR